MLSERQQEILTTAVEIIAAKGIQGLTIKNLSKEIGISEAAIYRHFDSKTSILMTILKSFEQESKNFLNNDQNMSPGDRIIDFFQRMLTVFQARPSIISVIFSEEIFNNDKDLSALIHSIMKNNQDYIENIIREGQNTEMYRNDIDSNYLTLYLTGAMHLMVKDWHFRASGDNLMKKGDDLLESFFELIQK
ncbi:MAG: TetR/AcrR family transcriptional regulator [Bacteroidales bacterium]|jgi:AcrR family transcriptional regulator|nr:TetR/AcrR family transcriptional regulator [Bacteroidales bacterium]